MKLAYHISTHRLPEQFKWLFDAIYDPRDTFVIHVSASSPDSFLHELHDIVRGKDNVFFQKRATTYYFDWSLCQVMLDGILAALGANRDWSYFLNLSAQDYPLKSRDDIVRELSSDPTRNYVRCKDLKDEHPRFSRWKNTRSILFRGKRFSTHVPTFDPRRHDVNWYGSFWHVTSRPFCEWITTDPYAKSMSDYLSRIRTPDEFLMQTYVMNGPFRDTLVNDNKRYIVWTGGASPLTLTTENEAGILASDAFFARKFDYTVDQAILERLRNRLRPSEPALTRAS